MKYFGYIVLVFLCGCSAKNIHENQEILSSVQIIDRNGFTETISSKSRLATFNNIDFLSSQPYKKVLRVFGRNASGQATKITSYHPNGQIWQYLETLNGRAYGIYKEWHSSGQLKLEAFVIEGIADIAEKAKMSWVFDGKSSAYDEEGRLEAEIFYSKGALEGSSLYYFPNGQIAKQIPYHADMIEGDVLIFHPNGNLNEKIPYRADLRHGKSEGFWPNGQIQYQESYENDLLKNGIYISFEGEIVGEVKEGEGKQASFKEGKLFSLQEFQEGRLQGKVELFDRNGNLYCLYHIEEGKKQGEEWEYYPKEKQPKLYLYWNDDAIEGMVKTWYPNGVLESEKEIHANKKHGLSFAWYEDGPLMLMEEYDNDKLIKGSYFKKGDKLPVSKIENGKGIATLYDKRGHFIKKISYDKGKPQLD